MVHRCLLAPASVHYGHAEMLLLQRHRVMLAAFEAHPEGFNRPPRRQHVPESVWINRPKELAGQGEGQPWEPPGAAYRSRRQWRRSTERLIHEHQCLVEVNDPTSIRNVSQVT